MVSDSAGCVECYQTVKDGDKWCRIVPDGVGWRDKMQECFDGAM